MHRSHHTLPFHKWSWNPFCAQFAELVHSPTLDLPKAAALHPTMQVLPKLDIEGSVLRATPPLDDDNSSGIEVEDDPCGVAEIMDSMGYRKDDIIYKSILQHTKNEATILRRALLREKLAWPQPFIESAYQFPTDGCINNIPILGFASNSRSFKAHDGHLGEITARMLQRMRAHREMKQFPDVFVLRYTDTAYVTAFRVIASENKAQLDTLVETEDVPEKKVRILCSVKDPFTDRGPSMLDASQRLELLQLLSSTLNSIAGH